MNINTRIESLASNLPSAKSQAERYLQTLLDSLHWEQKEGGPDPYAELGRWIEQTAEYLAEHGATIVEISDVSHACTGMRYTGPSEKMRLKELVSYLFHLKGYVVTPQGTAGGDADLPAGFLFPPPVTYVTGFFLGNLRSPNPLLFMKTKKRTIQGFAVRDLSDKGGSRLPKGM